MRNLKCLAAMLLVVCACISCSNDEESEIPMADHVVNTYQYQSTLEISVMGTSYGSTDQGKVIIKRAETGTGVDITIEGFDKMDSDNSAMAIGNFTVKDVTLAAGADGAYTLTLADYKATDSNNKEITGVSLTGTVAANGVATITTAFKPGSMPMAITASFTGNHTKL